MLNHQHDYGSQWEAICSVAERLGPLRGGRRDGTGLALKTVRNAHVMLHRAFEDAVEHDRVRRNPAARAQPPTARRARKPAAQQRTWTRHDAEAFVGHVAGDPLRALYALVLTTGLRRSEVLGLAWDHVDLDDGHLTVVQSLVEVERRPRLKPFPKTDHSRRRIASGSRSVEEATHTLPWPWRPEYRSRWSRLGHASIAITADLYRYVTKSVDRNAAKAVAELIFGGS